FVCLHCGNYQGIRNYKIVVNTSLHHVHALRFPVRVLSENVDRDHFSFVCPLVELTKSVLANIKSNKRRLLCFLRRLWTCETVIQNALDTAISESVYLKDFT